MRQTLQVFSRPEHNDSLCWSAHNISRFILAVEPLLFLIFNLFAICCNCYFHIPLKIAAPKLFFFSFFMPILSLSQSISVLYLFLIYLCPFLSSFLSLTQCSEWSYLFLLFQSEPLIILQCERQALHLLRLVLLQGIARNGLLSTQCRGPLFWKYEHIVNIL